MGAGGKIRDGVVTVAIGDDAVARAGGKADAGEALAGKGNATGDRVAGVAVADGDEEQTRSDGALHIGDGAGDDILAGSSEAAGERGGVGAHDGSGGGGVVGRAPVVGERIRVGIGGGGGEGDLRAGGDVERARGEREGGRAIAGERAEVHPHIGAAFAGGVGGDSERGEVNLGLGIDERLADDERRIRAAGSRGWRGVDEVEVVAAVLRPPPTEEDAIGGPLIFHIDQRAEFGPVGALGVFREFQRVAFGGVELCLVEGVEAVGAAGGDRLHKIVREPTHLVFRLRVEVVAREVRAGGAHDVEDVAVFEIRTGADGAGTAGVPEIGMRETEAVAELVGDRAG